MTRRWARWPVRYAWGWGLLLGALVCLGFGLHWRSKHARPEEPTVSSEVASGVGATSTDEGNVAINLGAYQLVMVGPAGGSLPPGSLAKIEGPQGVVAEAMELGVRLGDQVGTLEIGALQTQTGTAVSSVEARATVSSAGHSWPGTLRYTLAEQPPRLTMAWSPELSTLDSVPIVLLLHVRSASGALFVPSRGVLLEETTVEGPFAVWLTSQGALGFSEGRFSYYQDTHEVTVQFGASFTVTLGAGADVTEAAYRTLGRPVLRQRGRAVPPTSGSMIVALGEQGYPVGVARAARDGRFELAVPPGPLRLFASLDGSRVSRVVSVPTFSAQEIPVPLDPMGRLHVRVRDADTGEPLPARIMVHGEGAREPNFGPHSRATGAGPLVDAEQGTLAVPLPVGRYRVSSSRGLEYTVDQRSVEVRQGETAQADLALRHAVDTPGWVGCDLHVHARLSFDSSVSLEDRVRSLASAGVDFAVPSEHNHLGTYASADAMGLREKLLWTPGVEVTTSQPSRGHFNVFPFLGKSLPRARHTDLNRIIEFVRRESPSSIIQVNHPRLTKGIGYFHAVRFDSQTKKGVSNLPRDFDTIEVMNGFDLPYPEKIEEVMMDWIRLLEAGRTHWATGSSDSHSVQYVWAGYPRTYVALAADHDNGGQDDWKPDALFDGLRHGHAFVTSGPFLEVSQGDAQPGDTLLVEQGKTRIHVRVRAAPWVDAKEIEVVVAGRSVMRQPLPGTTAVVGPPSGTLADARRDAVRFDDDLLVPVDPTARTLVVLVRGGRSMADTLPFMTFVPLAISNPMFLRSPP